MAKRDREDESGRTKSKKKKQKLAQPSSPAPVSLADNQPSTSGRAAAATSKAAARGKETTAKIWEKRAHELVELCLESGATGLLAKALANWEPAEMSFMLTWPPERTAGVLAEWEAQQAAAVLQAAPCKYVAKCCESFEAEKIAAILPLLTSDKAVGKILKRLYFKSSDPYLSAYDCQQVLLAFKKKRRKALLKKFKSKAVRVVMEATQEDNDPGSDSSETDENTYDRDDSFIDDGSDAHVSDSDYEPTESD